VEDIKIKVTVTPSLNKIKGRWSRINWNKRYRRQLNGYERYALKIPQKMVVNIIRHGSRALDKDNLAGGCKSLIDAIRRAGLIVDDSPKWVDLCFSQIATPRELEHTEVIIKPAEAEREQGTSMANERTISARPAPKL